MRKLWPIVIALTLGVVGPLPAQFTATSLGGSTKTINVPRPNTVGISQMLPKYNINQALLTRGQSGGFSFSKMLPNFGWMSNRWPLQTGHSQIPASAFGPYKNLLKR